MWPGVWPGAWNYLQAAGGLDLVAVLQLTVHAARLRLGEEAHEGTYEPAGEAYASEWRTGLVASDVGGVGGVNGDRGLGHLRQAGQAARVVEVVMADDDVTQVGETAAQRSQGVHDRLAAAPHAGIDEGETLALH
jgi:hypothetical protein